MQPLIVLNVVGLTPKHLGRLTPRLSAFAKQGGMRPMTTTLPAVTCTAQASFMTGLPPDQTGIVANGWLFRDLYEIWFWRQSNRLVKGEKIWEAGKARNPQFTCANMFWWYNMASDHDFGATPRPIYKADGRKLPDCFTVPTDWREKLSSRLGKFPLFNFWGPNTNIASTRWIAKASELAITDFDPTLTLVYLPHLDYDLQRYGPDESHPAVAKSLQEVDQVVGDLIDFAQKHGRKVMVLSEYGITPVDRPIHLNRHFRREGWLQVRMEDGHEMLDPTTSAVFAVADHQIAHIYIRNPALIPQVKQLLQSIAGVESVWDKTEQVAHHINHERSGELVVMSDARSWFTYYFWLDDALAPDFARTVEIHRKAGYDPVELFLDPAISFPKVKIIWKLVKKILGFRMLMDVIPLDATLVKGSHGRPTDDPQDGPLVMTDTPHLLPAQVAATDIKNIALQHIFGESPSSHTAS
jgi:predicted AlkP superfamily pyrophosphatase or phosphodiesterase